MPWTSSMRWIGLIGVLTLTLARLATVFADQTVFDVDPARFLGDLGALGPAGSLWLDVLLLVMCGVGLLGEASAGRGICWWMIVLALTPAPVVLWHGTHELEHLWRGSTWVAAAMSAVTLAHLTRDPALRRLAFAVLAAAVAPLLVRGVMQVTLEHQATVAAFERNSEAFFQDQGWTPGSPETLIYERRLRQPQPLGWFVTSNIYATVMAWGLVTWIGLAFVAARTRLTSGWIGVSGLTAAAAAVALWLTGSKGALLAAAAAVFAFIVLGRASLRRLAPVLLVAMVVATWLGVIARGVVLPEGFANEKSLLFRWHYMTASVQIIADEPVVGVGPGGYQAAYARFRPPRNPEEVVSSHSMFVDWVSMLGVAGLAWVALVVVLMWRAGRRASDEDADPPPPGVRAGAPVTLIVATLGLLAATLVERGTLDPLAATTRGLGVIGFAAVAGVAAFILSASRSAAIERVVIAGVVAIVVHAQIEMTFYQPGSVVWALAVLGVAGAAPSAGRGRMAAAVSVLPLVLAALLVPSAARATSQSRAMREAAATLAPFAVVRAEAGFLANETTQAARRDSIIRLKQALADLGIPPGRVDQLQLDRYIQPQLGAPDHELAALLPRLVPARRADAASRLTEAFELCPSNPIPMEEAVRQMMNGEGRTADEHRMALGDAEQLVHRLLEEHDRPQTYSLAATLYEAKQSWPTAIEFRRMLVAADPNAVITWQRLGDTLWSSGDHAAAIDAYRETLIRDANFELDVLKRLSDKDRVTIEERIGNSS